MMASFISSYNNEYKYKQLLLSYELYLSFLNSFLRGPGGGGGGGVLLHLAKRIVAVDSNNTLVIMQGYIYCAQLNHFS